MARAASAGPTLIANGRGGSPAATHLRRRLWLAAWTLSLATAWICGWSLVRSRDAATQRTETQARNTANLLGRDVGALLDKSALVAGTVASALQRQIVTDGRIDRATLWHLVDEEAARVPKLSAIGVFDSAGRQVCGEPASRCRGVMVADRPYFAAASAAPDSGPRLFGPYISRLDGEWTLAMVQPLRDRSGAFAGVVVAMLPVASIEATFSSVDLGPSGAVSLRTEQLELLVRYPGARLEKEARNTLVSEQLEQAVRDSPEHGVYRAASPVDGVDRHNAYRQVPGHPLFVIVGLADAEHLASWRLEAAWITGFLALFLVATGAIVTLLAQGIRRKEVIGDLYDNAPCGYHSLDAAGIYRHVNDTELQWLGCTRQQVVGKLGPADFLTEEGKRRFGDHMALLRRTGHLEGAEYELVGRDGAQRHVLVAANALYDADGGFRATSSVMHDITELHRAREQLREMTQELDRRVAERTAQVGTLAAELELAESRERRQIARDLHDDLAQTLAAAHIRLAPMCGDERADISQCAQEVDELVRSADRATRSLASQLAPAALYELGLVPALEGLCDEIEEQYGVLVDLSDDGQDKPLSQQARSILYRAVRELLINVAKHARAPSALVEVLRDADTVVARVSDAGVGFDERLLAGRAQRGLGLVSVRERLSFIGGSVELRSIPGDGTVATLTVPVSREAVEQEVGA